MTTTESLAPRRELALLLTLAGIQFTHILDFMIMMPLGPQLRELFGISDAQFGLLISSYTLAAGASGLLASTYIDRHGRKRLLLALYLAFAAATIACGLAPSYGLLMAARIAAGVFGGVLTALCQTIVADVVPFERRGRAMGIVMTSFSISTVAGVPLGLFLAAHFSWHMPFLAIGGVSLVFAGFAAATLPRLEAHLQAGRPPLLGAVREVLADPNHRRAFALTALVVGAGFAVIPYITLYLQSNAGLPAQQIPYIYLCGGVATLFTARLFGRLTDERGKVPAFRALAVAAVLPMVGVTVSAGLPLAGILVITTLFFSLVSGRMIPAMAIVTSAAQPRLRGTFMTLNASVQSAAMGVAAYIGGQVVSRDPQGLMQGYWLAGLLGVAASAAAVWLVPRLTMHGASGTQTAGTSTA